MFNKRPRAASAFQESQESESCLVKPAYLVTSTGTGLCNNRNDGDVGRCGCSGAWDLFNAVRCFLDASLEGLACSIGGLSQRKAVGETPETSVELAQREAEQVRRSSGQKEEEANENIRDRSLTDLYPPRLPKDKRPPLEDKAISSSRKDEDEYDRQIGIFAAIPLPRSLSSSRVSTTPHCEENHIECERGGRGGGEGSDWIRQSDLGAIQPPGPPQTPG